jgi:hypothetical protein
MVSVIILQPNLTNGYNNLQVYYSLRSYLSVILTMHCDVQIQRIFHIFDRDQNDR